MESKVEDKTIEEGKFSFIQIFHLLKDFDEKDVGITEFLFEGQSLLVRYKYRFGSYFIMRVKQSLDSLILL